MMCTLYHSRINHLAFSSSVREEKLFDAKHGLLDNLLEPKFCVLRPSALFNEILLLIKKKQCGRWFYLAFNVVYIGGKKWSNFGTPWEDNGGFKSLFLQYPLPMDDCLWSFSYFSLSWLFWSLFFFWLSISLVYLLGTWVVLLHFLMNFA